MQFLVLAYSHQYSQLIANLGNIALLRIAAEVDLIDAHSATTVANAYRILRSRQHRLRLDGAEKTRVDIESELELIQAREAVLSLWQEIFKASSDI